MRKFIGSLALLCLALCAGCNHDTTKVSMDAPFLVLINPDNPAPESHITQAVTPGTQIGRFKIVNNGDAQAQIRRFKVTDLGYHMGSNVQYKVYYLDENSTNYTANTATSGNSLDFGLLAQFIPVNGGAYRFVTVSIMSISGTMEGDSWQLSIAQSGDVTWNALEKDLGYDANGDGTINEFSPVWNVVGTPTLGKITKQ